MLLYNSGLYAKGVIMISVNENCQQIKEDKTDLSSLKKQHAVCNLHLYIPTMIEEKSYTPIPDKNGEVIYYGKPYYDEYTKAVLEFDPDYYSHFQFVVNRDGTLWYEANRYLLNMLNNDTAYLESQRVSKKTIKEHASALQRYKWFCDERDDELIKEGRITEQKRKEMPFWRVAKRPTSRPNFVYKKHLMEQGGPNKKKLAPRTIKKYIEPITSFYEFIIKEYGRSFLDIGKHVVMPGKVVDYLIPTERGAILSTGNEANRVPVANNENNGYIHDGGNTKPLKPQQQEQIFRLIFEKGQPEINISHYFAIETAARMNTVFTLRLRHFMKTLPLDDTPQSLAAWKKENDTYDVKKIYRIKIGGSELVDTKGLDRSYELQVPGVIMQVVQRYCMSERAIHRRKNIKFPQKNPLNEYVFITKNYDPYYCSKSDPNKEKYTTLPAGGALRRYKKDHIDPYINFEYKFHFLRATALWNLLQGLKENGEMSEDEMLQDVAKLAGHRDTKTTKGYLNYTPNEEARYRAIDQHGEKLYQWAKDFLPSNE